MYWVLFFITDNQEIHTWQSGVLGLTHGFIFYPSPDLRNLPIHLRDLHEIKGPLGRNLRYLTRFKEPPNTFKGPPLN